MSIRSRRSSAARNRQRRRYTSRLRERTRVRSPPHVPRTALTHARSFEAPSADSVLDHVQDLFDRGVEHLQGKSLAPIRDGTGLGSALPSEFVCSSPEEQSLQVLSIILDASREFGVDKAIASISGAPSPDQAFLLESKVGQAAAKCSRCLASYLRCSQRSASSGSPIKVELLSALVRALRDKDVTLAQDIDHGLSLGIDRPLEPTGLFPPYSHHDQASALERFHLGIRANYKSVEMNQAVTERLIEEEIRASHCCPVTV
ncbi:hypothetical protein FOZ62_001656 [Perkinsus olseni]|uniref:Uncharacterized protein n=1 Tax=Perkinsus olseni TaxID=32597 RepID=A0A7J6QBM6_PEROL|nr:hypothetical protein FOZ62_001656 [Perkinsus olseni]